jgi:5-methylcytosine-specific restriction protein A
MTIRQALERISSDYGMARKQTFAQHPLANYIRHSAVAEVETALKNTDGDLIVEGSPGAGNWASVPWIGVFDPLVTDSATRGYYVVYLFHALEPIIHLSLNQGTTAAREEFGAETRKVLTDRAAFIRKRISDIADMLPVTSIDLGSEARLPGDYAAGHALGVTYKLHNLPNENELQYDLQTAVRAYRALTFRGGVELSNDEDLAVEDLASHSLLERRQYRLHRRIERNAAAARLVKQQLGTRCQACGLDFAERYGRIGQGFIEAHHLRPISSLMEGAAVKYDVATDFAVLCSNCHRMIHRTNDPADLLSFRLDILQRLMQPNQLEKLG